MPTDRWRDVPDGASVIGHFTDPDSGMRFDVVLDSQFDAKALERLINGEHLDVTLQPDRDAVEDLLRSQMRFWLVER